MRTAGRRCIRSIRRDPSGRGRRARSARIRSTRRRSSRSGASERLDARSRRSFNDDISLEDAIHTALLTLKEGFEGQMTEKTIEIGIISGVSKSAQAKAAASADGADAPAASTELPTFRRLTEAEIRDYLAL